MTIKLLAIVIFGAFTALAALEVTGPQDSLLTDGPVLTNS
jgi:hypothetical protein